MAQIQLDKRLLEALAKFHPEPKTAAWDCHGRWVVYHKDVELMAAKAGIKFGAPTIIEGSGERKVVAMLVTASLGDVTDWATGEAAPSNNKNSYPYAMAEKRARDRVAIKLLGLHGLYSEDEADDFKRAPAHETPADEPDITELLASAEKSLQAAAMLGTISLVDTWKRLPADTRDALGGVCPNRFKTLAKEHDERKAA